MALDLDSDQDDYVVMLNNNSVDQFMIDSGTSVNIIDKSTFEVLQQKGFEFKFSGYTSKCFHIVVKLPSIFIANSHHVFHAMICVSTVIFISWRERKH